MANIINAVQLKNGNIQLEIVASKEPSKSATGIMDLYISGGFGDVPNLTMKDSAGNTKQVKAMIQLGVDSPDSQAIKADRKKARANAVGK